MERIADAIGFLASWHLTAESTFYLQVQGASPSEKSFIQSNLCRFDKEIFFELGQDLRKLAADPCQKSRFIGRRSMTRLPVNPSSSLFHFSRAKNSAEPQSA